VEKSLITEEMDSAFTIFSSGRIPPSTLAVQLEQLGIEMEEKGYLRPGKINTLIFHEAACSEKLDELVSALSLLQPSRFFVLICHDQIRELTVEVRCQCHVLASAKTACTEVVHIEFPPGEESQAISIVTANLIPGTLRQLVALDCSEQTAILEMLCVLADEVFFSSDQFFNFFQTMWAPPFSKTIPVDLGWIEWSFLRDEVRQVFENEEAAGRLNQLAVVTLSISYHTSQKVPISLLLFVGWILDRLQLEPIALSIRGYECQTDRGETVLVRLHYDQGEVNRGRISVAFGTNQELTDNIATLSFCQDQTDWVIQSSCINGSFSTMKRLRVAVDAYSLLKRHFHVGESFVNYFGSVNTARQLDSLSHAFFYG
jgi:glucose-6-phosphate dehydrogenase assembly protein OpcA